jgi:hypothetical protein
MKQDAHISDSDLLRHMEGELPSSASKRIVAHIAGCWKCRARRQELETAITDFVRVYQGEMEFALPPAAGPRALLKARMAQLSSSSDNGAESYRFDKLLSWSIGLVGILGLGLAFFLAPIRRTHGPVNTAEIVSVPDSRFAPGATVLLSRNAVCSQEAANNRTVSSAVQLRVLEEYGIAGADPRAYEIDYLVTPALGGADDIRNLWPHSHSATVWNAAVKDDLENRLRQMVCQGSLDLAEAQRDIAVNWIDAYKKYFHTDRPIEEHLR